MNISKILGNIHYILLPIQKSKNYCPLVHDDIAL